MSGQQYFDVLDLAEEADKIVEHYYFTSYGGYSPDPCVFLAAYSQRTRRLRMVTGAGRTGAAGHRWTADGRPAAPR